MNLANFKLVFDRKKEATLAKAGLIQIECYRKGFNRVWVSTGIKVFSNQWNKKGVTDRHPNSFDLNKALKKMVDDFQRYDSKQHEKGVIVPLQFYKTFAGSDNSNDFKSFFQKEFEDNPHFEANTKKNYNTTLKHIAKFGKVNYFSDLNYANIEGFNRYLKGLGLSDTTIQKYHKCLRKVVNEALKKGLIDKTEDPYENFVVKAKAPKKSCLTIEEIRKIENMVIPEKMTGLEKARDMFLFCVYTGNRFSDLIQISNKTITFNQDGVYFERISKKTKKPELFKLGYFFKNETGNSKPENIIFKYRDFLGIKPFNISLQQYNQHLKIIGKTLKITKKLTSHTARHTFGTYMIDKISTPALQKLMGHSDINTTMIYVHMKEEMAQEELKNVKNWN